MQKKRQYGMIRMYDYANKAEFEKHKAQMESKGWILIENGMFGGTMSPAELDCEHFKFTACFIKSDMI